LIILLWIFGSIIAGFVGIGRRIGFLDAFLLSLFLSPLIGIIVAALSKSNVDIDREKKILNSQIKQEKALQKISEQTIQETTYTISDEILKLKELQNQGILTEEEFEAQKKKLLEM
jgi:phosphate/sulfate permease